MTFLASISSAYPQASPQVVMEFALLVIEVPLPIYLQQTKKDMAVASKKQGGVNVSTTKVLVVYFHHDGNI